MEKHSRRGQRQTQSHRGGTSPERLRVVGAARTWGCRQEAQEREFEEMLGLDPDCDLLKCCTALLGPALLRQRSSLRHGGGPPQSSRGKTRSEVRPGRGVGGRDGG